nr:hypothetical protein [uncultured Bdellovibrio sp.]
MRQLILTALIIAVGACSFKKDPEKNQRPLILIQEKEVSKKKLTLEEIISQENEEKALKELSEIRFTKISDIKTTDGSLIDTAIKFDKKNILNYLLIQGHSPFIMTEATYNKLSYSDELNKIIGDAQRDRFIGILRNYSSEEEQTKFKSSVTSNRLGFIGCQNFINFLMNLKYSHPEKGNPGYYYEVLKSIHNEEMIKTVLKETECSSLSNKFSSEKLSEWLANEILDQFRNNFSSSEFFEFISSLGPAKALSINLANNNRIPGPALLKIDPMLLLMVKKSCFDNEELFLKWISLIKKHVDRGDATYSFRYVFPDELSENEKANSCEGDPEYCSSFHENANNMTYAYGLLFKAQHYDDILYSTIWTNLSEEPLTEEAAKIKKEVCKSLNEKIQTESKNSPADSEGDGL